MIYSGLAISWLLRAGTSDQRNPCTGLDETKRGLYLRKFGLLTSACVVILFSALVHAQETDLAVGAGTLFSTYDRTSSQVYAPPGERSGLYPSVSYLRTLGSRLSFQDRFSFENHIGVDGEVAALFRRGLYNGVQEFRPVLYDINGVFQGRFNKSTVGDFMVGPGGERLLFYRQNGDCTSPTGCKFLFNSNHFLIDIGADVRYTVWRHFFVRPEAHFYRIFNNNEFHSGNVLRLGVSVGYTFSSQ